MTQQAKVARSWAAVHFSSNKHCANTKPPRLFVLPDPCNIKPAALSPRALGSSELLPSSAIDSRLARSGTENGDFVLS